jgi:predicted metal-dependent phosphoesterase TrpH
MYKYETHLHTSPVSRCGQESVRDSLEFYKSRGYDGVFITNHFLDGNIGADLSLPYDELINFYFSDYEDGLKIGKEIGLKVFCGVEMSYKGTDFLIYGLKKKWYLDNPQIMGMKKSDELKYLAECGALVIQAHPYREEGYINHIRLFPRCVHGVEIINACGTEDENKMAELYAEHYGLLKFAGSDNHIGGRMKKLAGLCCDNPIFSEEKFIDAVKKGKMTVFVETL